MSTGEPHPSAAIGVLTAPTNSPEPGAAELGVLILRGKYFAFSRTFYPEDPDDPPASGELWVWDWQSGRAHYMDEVEGEHALAFLDNEHIALARASYTGDQLDCWWIEVFRIPPTIGETGPRVRFWLPEFVQWISCIEFTLRCEPNGPTIDPPSRDGSTPFASHPSHNLLELFIHCRDGHMTNWPFRVYMLTSKLLSLYEGALRDSPGLTGVTMEDWLPESTRWFPHVYTNPLVCHIHGQRFLTVSANRMQLSILDFNLYLLARSQSEESGTPGPTGSVEEVFVTESSVHAIPSVFSGVFESALPYREISLPFSLTTLPSPEECGGLMLDSERIIVVGEIDSDPIQCAVLSL